LDDDMFARYLYFNHISQNKSFKKRIFTIIFFLLQHNYCLLVIEKHFLEENTTKNQESFEFQSIKVIQL